MSRPSPRPLPAFLTGSALLASLLLAAMLPAGCSRSKPEADAPGADQPARAQRLIDAGNALYRAGDYTAAAKRYGAAIAVRPDDPAAHYGLGMALAKLGRDEEAREAYAQARDLAERARGQATAAP